jgi:hypothetical protein
MQANADAGFYFFSPDTMSCFNSRVPGQTPIKAEFSDDLYFFVTSERSSASDGTKFPRRWHVRTYRHSTGDCGSGAGSDFTTKENALKAARLFAQGLFVLGYCHAIRDGGSEFFANEWSSVNQEYVEFMEEKQNVRE